MKILFDSLVALFFLLFALECVPGYAVKEYYSLSRSYRALGMGGAFYGLSDDEDALFYNPAGLALYPGGAQFMIQTGAQASADAVGAVGTIENVVSSKSLATGATQVESLFGKSLYAGENVLAYFVARGFAVGILVDDLKADVALLGNSLSSTVDVTAISDSGIFIGKSFTIAPNLYAGATLKGLFRAGGWGQYSVLDIIQNTSISLASLGGAGAGIDGDVGVTYTFGAKGAKAQGAVSLTVNNVAATTFPMYQTGTPPALPRYVSLGTFVTVNAGKGFDNIRILLDVAEINLGGQGATDLGRRTSDFWKHLNFGVEFPLVGVFALRAGVHQGDFTAGLGINLYALKLNFVTYGEELDSWAGRFGSRRYALEIAFGFGAPRTDAVQTASSTSSSGSSRSRSRSY